MHTASYNDRNFNPAGVESLEKEKSMQKGRSMMAMMMRMCMRSFSDRRSDC